LSSSKVVDLTDSAIGTPITPGVSDLYIVVELKLESDGLTHVKVTVPEPLSLPTMEVGGWGAEISGAAVALGVGVGVTAGVGVGLGETAGVGVGVTDGLGLDDGLTEADGLGLAFGSTIE
jgi:hypothetical protein